MQKITPQEQDFATWYTDVIEAAQMADYSPVRGCMVIRPYGYSIWENIQKILDEKIKETGHENAYFPLLIPKSFLSREAAHVEGFAKECAVVTHSRLKAVQKDGKSEVVVDPESKLEEELVIRPTSETIMHTMFAKWIQSWRDLPLLINQWANIVRWEMRTRLFLRTAEFLWQEGHTAHATQEEAQEETIKMLGVYSEFMENYLALPVVPGAKSTTERFAGAAETYAVEALMRDGKALQAGTSHNLGQNFAKAFNIQFQDKNGQLAHVWQTSWGVSTRLIGAIILAHGDNQGLILPPRVAPVQIVIVPIYKKEEERTEICKAAHALKAKLSGFKVKVDDRDQMKPGAKFFEWEKRGVPLRVELGPRDVAENKVVVADRLSGKKTSMPIAEFLQNAQKLLDQFQQNLLERAREFRRQHTFHLDSYEEFKQKIEGGGFFALHWCGSATCEEKIKEETKATIRCMPLDAKEEKGKCIYCQAPSNKRVIIARAY
jgi:prolyl-tRNA synthetase